MSDGRKVVNGTGMDGFGRIPPLTEGPVVKGGRNLTSKIIERPPAPPILSQGGKAPAPAPAAKTGQKSSL